MRSIQKAPRRKSAVVKIKPRRSGAEFKCVAQIIYLAQTKSIFVVFVVVVAVNLNVLAVSLGSPKVLELVLRRLNVVVVVVLARIYVYGLHFNVVVVVMPGLYV